MIFSIIKSIIKVFVLVVFSDHGSRQQTNTHQSKQGAHDDCDDGEDEVAAPHRHSILLHEVRVHRLQK